ncbi:hypothetical protein [Chitinophaga arvensicola]|uniref:Uncharacterized protein n=1 Tax=Chitinophaga arvensicola TaxID=29529 RepID=A0A1I0S6W8_9BACT|nr:hypothetical protein [Chitinophaga arvensicola]SEW51480.1 hypothetical protein SAMN04488122_4254 [Chitinophaga arvensicola]
MKGFWSYFGIVYLLFFAIPFPMLLYYNTAYREMEYDGGTAPWLALTYLALAAILWILLIQRWLRKWVLMPFLMRKNILRLLKEGILKDARVIQSKELAATPEIITKDLLVSLRNFSGTEITERLTVNDSKPALRRYETGKTFSLRIDQQLKTIPYLVPDGVEVDLKIGRMILLFLVWLVVTAAVVWYFGFSYELENSGRGWRFLKFYHPLVLCPLIILLSAGGLRLLLNMMIGSPEKDLQLKYYGIRTDAAIISASQTGTYINEQPQIKFELSFQDNSGKTHVTSLKKIVSLLDLDSTKQVSVPIFYLKDKPTQVIFASDLETETKLS